MITVNSQRKVIGTDRYCYDLKGLSTDEKPSEIYGIKIVENSFFLEMDTGDLYYFTGEDWEEATYSGGGGGSPEPTEELLYYSNGSTTTEVSANMYQCIMQAILNYSSLIVEFDGNKYTVENNASGYYDFGATLNGEVFDFSTYPFNLYYYEGPNYTECWLSTESAGTYSLKIWANSDPVIISG